MNVARLNFSHGTHKVHAAYIQRLRHITEHSPKNLAIFQDLQGPKIRIGKLASPRFLIPGDHVIVRAKIAKPDEQFAIPVDFPQLFWVIKKGDHIMIDDGRLVLRVIKKTPDSISTEVITGGELKSQKGINLPGVHLDIPAVTNKDIDDIKFGLSVGVDAIALSFVQTADDVEIVRALIKKKGKNAPLLFAKLERPEALKNLNTILNIVDGVMVARGDLGVEMAPEEVPEAQKHIIREANKKGKIVITATQMLETMIISPLPTRAEASDIANAIYDGTDAVMLSAETAVGKYPVESVAMMDRIIRQAESSYELWGRGPEIIADTHDDAAALARAARELAHDRDVEAIAVFTNTGRTAFTMAKARPCVPILAFTTNDDTYRKLAIAWGITPARIPWAKTVEEMILHVEAAIRRMGIVQLGGQIVLVSGFPVQENRAPNMALLHTLT